jgi:beta-phosphoglucomutase-like phosphatase (HAD superfamily)
VRRRLRYGWAPFDTEALYQEAILLAATEGGHEVAPDFFGRTVDLPWVECRALLLSHFGESFAVDEFQAAWVRHFWVIAETCLALKPGALELLDTLDRFRLHRAITTSSHPSVERHLTAHDLAGLSLDRHRAEPIRAQQHDPRPPHMLLRAVFRSDHGLQRSRSPGPTRISTPFLIHPESR